MSLWYDIRSKKYASSPGDSWLRSYTDRTAAALEGELSSALSRHTSGESSRHLAEDIDCADGGSVQTSLDAEASARAAADSSLERLISAETAERNTALYTKVDKVSGKSLSSNDYTTAEKQKLLGIEAGAQINEVTAAQLSQKVDKVGGKGLSSNDYTTTEKQKLLGIEAGAQANRVTSVAGKDGAVTLGIGDIDGLEETLDRLFDSTYKTYGVSVDLTNSNPETAVQYINDSVGMRSGSADWDETEIFKNIRPCLFSDGRVVGYLKRNNFSKFEDDSDADITSGNSGDVMIEIPKLGYKLEKTDNTLTVRVTNDPDKDGFCYLAHTRQTEGDREKLYIGAFLGCEQNFRLRSLSGRIPSTEKSISEFRNLAHIEGSGFDLLSFYQLTLIQCLYLIKYKNLNSQSAIGSGYIANVTTDVLTGATAASGMDYGSASQTQQMKFLGIEDLWGNLFCYIDGIKTDEARNIYTATSGFASNDSYINRGHGRGASLYTEYMTAPSGTNETGFVPALGGGSATTYFSDTATVEFVSRAYFGSPHGAPPAEGPGSAGIFSLYIYMGGSATPYHSARLMYL